MTSEELLKVPCHEPPVLCADGSMGKLICYPSQDDLAGVQVFAEEEIRWVPVSQLTTTSKGAITQAGAPSKPAPTGLAQQLVALHWVALQD